VFDPRSRRKTIVSLCLVLLIFMCLNVLLFGTVHVRVDAVDLATFRMETTTTTSVLGMVFFRREERHDTVVSSALSEAGMASGLAGRVICLRRRWRFFSEVYSHSQQGRLVAHVAADLRWRAPFRHRPELARSALLNVVGYALSKDADGTELERLICKSTTECSCP